LSPGYYMAGFSPYSGDVLKHPVQLAVGVFPHWRNHFPKVGRMVSSV
jgi:hypothetical protein